VALVFSRIQDFPSIWHRVLDIMLTRYDLTITFNTGPGGEMYGEFDGRPGVSLFPIYDPSIYAWS
jgi:hypothetical protein